MQVWMSAGLLPVPGAWSASVHSKVSRATQVFMSPNTRLMFAPLEQLCRLAHSVWPSMEHASAMVRLPPPSAPRFGDTFPHATTANAHSENANDSVGDHANGSVANRRERPPI